MIGWEYIVAMVAALASGASSIWAVKSIIKHEAKMCDERMAAFREGLRHGEKIH